MIITNFNDISDKVNIKHSEDVLHFASGIYTKSGHALCAECASYCNLIELDMFELKDQAMIICENCKKDTLND